MYKAFFCLVVNYHSPWCLVKGSLCHIIYCMCGQSLIWYHRDSWLRVGNANGRIRPLAISNSYKLLCYCEHVLLYDEVKKCVCNWDWWTVAAIVKYINCSWKQFYQTDCIVAYFDSCALCSNESAVSALCSSLVSHVRLTVLWHVLYFSMQERSQLTMHWMFTLIRALLRFLLRKTGR